MVEINTSKPRAQAWNLNFLEYNKFYNLCQRKQWQTLPLANDDLKDLTRKGINGKPFNRSQLEAKCKKQRTTTLSILHTIDRRFVGEEDIPPVDKLLEMVNGLDMFDYFPLNCYTV